MTTCLVADDTDFAFNSPRLSTGFNSNMITTIDVKIYKAIKSIFTWRIVQDGFKIFVSRKRTSNVFYVVVGWNTVV